MRALSGGTQAGAAAHHDIVLRNGLVADGSGGPLRRVDVAVDGDRIASVGEGLPGGRVEIDAAGCIVAPGFIDIHSHSDYTLLVDPRAVSAIHQGVTLEVIGNCGHGCFPVRDPVLARTALYGFDERVPLAWQRADEYFEQLDAARPAVNVASLVPNGQLRLSAVGLHDRPATSRELREMERALEQALAQGAWGYSTGLEYAWEQGATEEEVETLCRVVARQGALYATHARKRDHRALGALQEALRVANASEVRLQVSHLTPRARDPALLENCLETIEQARQDGTDVCFDMHSRLFGITYLHAALPPDILAQPPAELAASLGRISVRDRVRGYESLLSAGGAAWSEIVLLDNSTWPQYARQTIAAIAEDLGGDPVDAVAELLTAVAEDTRQLMVIIHCYSEQQQKRAFTHPLCMPGSDATTLAPEGPLAASFFHGAYSWAAWYIRYMTRDAQLLSIPEAIRRLTRMPAERLGIADRGVIQRGAFADIAVFAEDTLTEHATTFEPNQLASGIQLVLVNGVAALRDGELTSERAGRVLRRA